MNPFVVLLALYTFGGVLTIFIDGAVRGEHLDDEEFESFGFFILWPLVIMFNLLMLVGCLLQKVSYLGSLFGKYYWR